MRNSGANRRLDFISADAPVEEFNHSAHTGTCLGMGWGATYSKPLCGTKGMVCSRFLRILTNREMLIANNNNVLAPSLKVFVVEVDLELALKAKSVFLLSKG